MLFNYHLLIKLALTIFTIFFSVYFFFVGYTFLNFNKLNIPIIFNNHTIFITNTETKKKDKFQSSSKNDYASKLFPIEELRELEKNDIIVENEIIIKVKKKDTFSKIISPYFQNNKIKNKIINEINKEYNLRNLKIDQEIYLYQNNKKIVEKIIIPIDFSTNIIVKISNKIVSLSKQNVKIFKELMSNKYLIKSSLYEDGIKANIPAAVLSEIIMLFSFDVDFQRDIQKNNQLEISYEVLINSRGNVSNGDIKFIKLSLQQKVFEYFMFLTDDGYIDYFDLEGKNIKKALMKTPIDGARLSSSYGMRKHPISGYNKLHKGVDFAAPKGTPIYAGGNGIIEFLGNNSGYGKFIRIRHNSAYKTLYAHLNNFKQGLHKGFRVNQGEIIGYVGSTGKSTGSHLHYEIIYQGKQINPMKVKLPPRKKIEAKELKRFIKESKEIYSNFLFSLYE